MDVPLLSYRIPETKPKWSSTKPLSIAVWPSTKGCASDHRSIGKRSLGGSSEVPSSPTGSGLAQEILLMVQKSGVHPLKLLVYLPLFTTNFYTSQVVWDFWNINRMFLSFSQPIVDIRSQGQPRSWKSATNHFIAPKIHAFNLDRMLGVPGVGSSTMGYMG